MNSMSLSQTFFLSDLSHAGTVFFVFVSRNYLMKCLSFYPTVRMNGSSNSFSFLKAMSSRQTFFLSDLSHAGTVAFVFVSRNFLMKCLSFYPTVWMNVSSNSLSLVMAMSLIPTFFLSDLSHVGTVAFLVVLWKFLMNCSSFYPTLRMNLHCCSFLCHEGYVFKT